MVAEELKTSGKDPKIHSKSMFLMMNFLLPGLTS